MIALLQQIVSFFVCWVETALVTILNALIAALGALLALLISLDPIDMPAPPTLPAPMTTALGWVAWVFPVGTAVSILVFFVTAWIMWQVVLIGLRWAKASGE